MSDEVQINRRSFLSYVIAAIGGFLAAAIGIPLAGAAILPTLRQRQPNWVNAGPVAGFVVGEPKPVQVAVAQRDGWIQQEEPKGMWVVRRGEADFTVFNGRCVHLGCAYNWLSERQQFLCPCHAGLYSIDGTVLGGPPPRPLDTLEWRVEQGNLMVAYTDFRLGVPTKEAI